MNLALFIVQLDLCVLTNRNETTLALLMESQLELSVQYIWLKTSSNKISPYTEYIWLHAILSFKTF